MKQTMQSIFENFIKKANIIHNNKYDYSKFVYLKSCVKGIIVCPIHKDFLQRPNDHLSGKGCSECGGTKKYTLEKFIKKSNEIHKSKYDYSLVNQINNRTTKILIICKYHDKFWQSPKEHLAGKGCQKCGFISRINKRKINLQQFIKQAETTHSFKYDYSKFVYINDETKGMIICKDHGEFSQSPNNHKNGRGCVKCVFKSEEICRKYFEFIFNYKFKKIRPKWLKNYKTGYNLELDGYCEELNVAFEHNGIQHYKVINKFKMTKNDLKLIKSRDRLKIKLCKKQGVKLIIIPHLFLITKLKNLKQIIIKECIKLKINLPLYS